MSFFVTKFLSLQITLIFAKQYDIFEKVNNITRDYYKITEQPLQQRQLLIEVSVPRLMQESGNKVLVLVYASDLQFSLNTDFVQGA